MLRCRRQKGIRTLYISPLKALGYDVERNLDEPMRGIEEAAKSLGVEIPKVRADVRTGDTPSSARARMVRNPPHILITTPESLYLILTSPRARSILSTVETVIVDEIHTLCANKRGVHLSITLRALGADRTGVSAHRTFGYATTIDGSCASAWRSEGVVGRLVCIGFPPLSPVSGYGAGFGHFPRERGNPASRSPSPWPSPIEGESNLIVEPRPVSIVDCPGSKKIEISVHGMPDADGGDPSSIWPKLIPRVLDDIEAT